MRSTAKDVADYLKEIPKEPYEALVKLRNLCLETLNTYEESMTYGMPSYKKGEVVEVAFASQKQFIALYILKKEIFDAHREELNKKGVSLGKGCIRYSKPDKIDFGVVKKLLYETMKSSSNIC